jgi:hypothetical protein
LFEKSVANISRFADKTNKKHEKISFLVKKSVRTLDFMLVNAFF